MKITLAGILVLLSGISIRCHAQQSQLFPAQLRNEARLHPDSLVGYTRVAENPDPTHSPSLSERTMILSLKTGKSFEILSALSDKPYTFTDFEYWLNGHRKAVIKWGFDSNPTPSGNAGAHYDEYVIDLAGIPGHQSFCPTCKPYVGYQNARLMPALPPGSEQPPKPASRPHCCYLFDSSCANGNANCVYEYRMNFDGTSKDAFPANGNAFGAHGCSVSPTGHLMACELPPPCKGYSDLACIRVFDTVTGDPIGNSVGPTPLGKAVWAPDGKKFVYFKGPAGSQIVLVDASDSTETPMGGSAGP